MMISNIDFTGALSLSRLIKIALSDYSKHSTDKETGVTTSSHQGNIFLADGTYISVHAFRMRYTDGACVEKFRAGLIETRIDADETAKRGHVSIYVTIHY